MIRNQLRCAVIAALAFASVGCMTYRGPIGVESAIEKQLGVQLDREFGVKLGWTSTKIMLSFMKDDDDEDSVFNCDLDGVGIATFVIPPGARKARLDPKRLGLGDWDTAVHARDADGDVLLVTREKHGKIRELILVVVDEEEVVLGRLKGDLGELVEKMVHDTETKGTRAARKTFPNAS